VSKETLFMSAVAFIALLTVGKAVALVSVLVTTTLEVSVVVSISAVSLVALVFLQLSTAGITVALELVAIIYEVSIIVSESMMSLVIVAAVLVALECLPEIK
jgi:hypothetical protein